MKALLCPARLARCRSSSTSRSCIGHGSGGKLTSQLSSAFSFRRSAIRCSTNSTIRPCSRFNGSRLAFTTDSFVVTPLFFPGGDIGHLAVNGTVNDLAMSGARPLYLSAAFILEEGLADGGPAPHRRIHGRRPREKPACNSSPAIPRSSIAARATRFSSRPPASALSNGRSASQPTARGPATRSSSAATSAITAWPSCRSARTWSSKASSRATRLRCTAWSPNVGSH